MSIQQKRIFMLRFLFLLFIMLLLNAGACRPADKSSKKKIQPPVKALPDAAVLPDTHPEKTIEPVQPAPAEKTLWDSYAEIERVPSRQHTYSVSASTPPADFKPSPEVECFGNFHTMGVIVNLPDRDKFGTFSVECSLNTDSEWRPVHEAVQVASTNNYAGSIFWLKPDTVYQVKVGIVNAKGESLAVYYGEGRTRAEPELPLLESELHVSPEGDDNAAGSEAQPLKTVGKAVELVKPGMAIVLHNGVYCEGDFALPDTRKSGKPIIVKALPGATPVFDNADPEYRDLAAWKDEGNGIFSRLFKGHCGMAGVIDKKTNKFRRLIRVPFLEDLQKRFYHKHKAFKDCGINGAYHTGKDRIYMILPEPTADYEIIVPKYTRAFDIYGNGNLSFDGITFKYFGRGQYNSALFFQDASDILVQNCSFIYCNMFVWLKRDCSRVTVQDSFFYDRFGGWSFSLLKGTHQGYHGEIEGGAVGTDGRYSGRGLVFRRNIVDGLFDGVHLCPFRENKAVTNETDVYDNVIVNIFDDYIETDGYSRNVRIFDNYMRVSLSGISLAQALDGPTFILYNVIADQGLVNGSLVDGYEGYPFKTNGGDGTEIGSGEVFFYHNTATTSEPDSNAVLIKHAKWRKFTFRNNIWTGRGKGFVSWRKDFSPMDWDYDNLYTPKGPWAILQYKTKYSDWDEFRKATGLLANGFNHLPGFGDEDEGDYSLKSDSGNIDKGIRVPGINDGRFDGSAPDIGAYEFKNK